jgi:hypothetical protein
MICSISNGLRPVGFVESKYNGNDHEEEEGSIN